MIETPVAGLTFNLILNIQNNSCLAETMRRKTTVAEKKINETEENSDKVPYGWNMRWISLHFVCNSRINDINKT